MHIEKRYELNAALDAVWNVISRIDAMKECIPNIDTFTKIDGAHFVAVVKPLLSFLTGKITMECEVLKIKKPFGQLKVHGKVIGANFNVTTQITISPTNNGKKTTALLWTADVEMQGLLKTAPESLVRAVIDRMADEMFKKVEELAKSSSDHPRADVK